jgi:hypothetical protein
MTTFTKSQMAKVRADLDKALSSVGALHGIDFSIGTIRFGAETMRTTLSGVMRGAAGTSTATKTDPKLVAFLTRGARLLGHPSINENDKFHSLGLGTVKFVGYNTRAKAYPFIVQTTGGKRYKINEARAKALADSGIVA